ncbi:hypothetical protein IQ06DRAFT_335305 [Phaeosphaeriaceae sp. SRC1lsM3a]|nr:hypothetical protein IQ06DRAFT_335305 [Stagonospora sp. SRC1lsM3a]
MYLQAFFLPLLAALALAKHGKDGHPKYGSGKNFTLQCKYAHPPYGQAHFPHCAPDFSSGSGPQATGKPHHGSWNLTEHSSSIGPSSSSSPAASSSTPLASSSAGGHAKPTGHHGGGKPKQYGGYKPYYGPGKPAGTGHSKPSWGSWPTASYSDPASSSTPASSSIPASSSAPVPSYAPYHAPYGSSSHGKGKPSHGQHSLNTSAPSSSPSFSSSSSFAAPSAASAGGHSWGAAKPSGGHSWGSPKHYGAGRIAIVFDSLGASIDCCIICIALWLV